MLKKFVLVVLCFHLISCDIFNKASHQPDVDVVLIGAGVMSGTLGVMLKSLNPEMTINIYERLDQVAAESSSAWNNAGTGHSAFAELNYTPEKEDGSIDISKALQINEQFELSKQFWAYQVRHKVIDNPQSFINNVPHMSFVWGDDNVKYLRKRFQTISVHPLFQGMEYSEDPEQLRKWIPLVMKGRDPHQKLAATRVQMGTDVNFGALTGHYFNYLQKSSGTKLYLRHEVRDIKRNDDGTWSVAVKNLNTNETLQVRAKFVFVGAGGGALPLLEKSGIPEIRGYGGFPVGGEWLVTENPELVQQHQAKVYGKASVGSPPMSVPHLDTRVIDGKKALLFGPFALFSTKYLKNGSWLDLPKSFNAGNVIPMVEAGLDNIPLTKYLISQLMMSPAQKMNALKEYFPEAKDADWRLEVAGQRVQVIKNDPKEGGILQFGTEVVRSADGSIVGLLGASPGASTAAPIMLKVIEKSFSKQLTTPAWQTQLREMFPSYGQSLAHDTELLNRVRKQSSEALNLYYVQAKPSNASEKKAALDSKNDMNSKSKDPVK